ncbi:MULTISPECIES: 3,4-dihydroxy-2-butanone-4-phosphate synthase [unclassified Achromobacter]|uniref:3,4-dihydroxy-2-butanone-4-phosphate synthase n=1 Tax=unclassified Achromobacter TaxID=2626865 RepID=UPI000B517A06|nr:MULTISPECIES: 3,4-dihydroxy-2-butanone-4-phosphate synthase [unclassified Achromobacter]OWT74363.1 3,4-dihydroxy-2-butanone-4-phosphate synthase [Achromobacter sp. HZ34]OWT78830.1 3,4-dihydroxy-2-butanone-4-phosphate synthase [Achromobacter sp. HZ28]
MSQLQNSLPTASAAPALDAQPFSMRLARALQHLRIGRPVIVMDDFDRENEADLIVAADKLTVPVMAQLIRDGSGIVCLCLTDEALDHLQLPQMVRDNGSRHGTAFTVSIEAREGVSTGVSAADRVTTIRAAIAPHAQPGDIVSPGHVFPLRAQPGGVLTRRGHTEGSVDLAMLAGLRPAAVLCELMNADGTMMRGAALERYAANHGLVSLTIAELADYRRGLLQSSASHETNIADAQQAILESAAAA